VRRLRKRRKKINLRQHTALDDVEERFPAEAIQIVVGAVELTIEGGGVVLGHLDGVHEGERVGEHDRTLEEVCAGRCHHMHAHAAGARRLTGDRDTVGITAERSNLRLHPAQGQLLVQEAVVAAQL
jgi:hypothetical protein